MTNIQEKFFVFSSLIGSNFEGHIEKQTTKELHEAFPWIQVDFKKMFRCLCYLTKGMILTELVTNEVGLLNYPFWRYSTNSKMFHETRPFVEGKIIKSWV